LVVVTLLALQKLSAPAARYLIISSNVTVAIHFQLEMASMLNVPVDVMCAKTCLLFDSFSFNCASETSAITQIACVPRLLMLSRLRAYKDVYLVESGAPHRLDRSPFDKAVYEHVRSQLGSDRVAHVTVVFTDVTCEGMRNYMRRRKTAWRAPPGGVRVLNASPNVWAYRRATWTATTCT
jgi:hypothetical protein